MNLITTLIVGALAGWLASKMMRGGGYGLFGSMAIGVVGGFLGSFILEKAGFVAEAGPFTYLVTALLGAVVLLFVLGLFKFRKK
jgi:uncharacterized membrane protein YeaQ/YmgE (transglycosylase-associated protein family)